MKINSIIGFDLSLTATGYAIGRVSEPSDSGLRSPLISHGVIQPGKKVDGVQRLNVILTRVAELIAADSLVILEGFSFASNGSYAREIAGLGWLVRWWLWKRGVRYLEIAPAQLKKFVAGKGNADKDLMLKEVLKRFALDLDNHNVADAVGLLYIGLALIGGWEPTTDQQRAVVTAVRNSNRTLLESLE